MTVHEATVRWRFDGEPRAFRQGQYSRAHTWTFDGGLCLPASPSPAVVKPPHSDPSAVDPEEAFVASVSSCHMLTFLYLAHRRGFEVRGYEDRALGTMTKNERGVPWVSRVVLRPHVTYGSRAPSASLYLVLATFFLASFLGLGKRLHELGQLRATERRSVLARYDERVLRPFLLVFGLVPVGIYVSYVIDPETQETFGSAWLPATTVFAVIGVFRFLHLVKSERDAEGPTEAMLRDPIFIANFVLWAASILLMLYA